MYRLVANEWNDFLERIENSISDENMEVRLRLDECSFYDLAEAVSLPLIACTLRNMNIDVSVQYYANYNKDIDSGLSNIKRINYLRSMGIKTLLDKYCNKASDPSEDEIRKALGTYQNYVAYIENAPMSVLPAKLITSESMVEKELLPLLSKPEMQKTYSTDEAAAIKTICNELGIHYDTNEANMKIDLINGGMLGSIVLYETAVNVEKHAKKLNSSGNTIGLAAFQKFEYDQRYDLSKTDWQKSYFHKTTSTKNFIRIVIGDNGPGIQGALEFNYRKVKNDYTIPSNRFQFNSKILEFSFDKFASREPNREEEGFITGLYKVLQLVKEKGGLLSICSGGVRLVVDCSERYQELNWQAYEVHKLFEGTLLDIVFPLEAGKNTPGGTTSLFSNSQNIENPVPLPNTIRCIDLLDQSVDLTTLPNVVSDVATQNQMLLLDLCNTRNWRDRGDKQGLKRILEILKDSLHGEAPECYLFGITKQMKNTIESVDVFDDDDFYLVGMDISTSIKDVYRPVHLEYIGVNDSQKAFMEGVEDQSIMNYRDSSVDTLIRSELSKAWLTYDAALENVSSPRLSDKERLIEIAQIGIDKCLLNEMRQRNIKNSTDGYVFLANNNGDKYCVSEYMPIEQLIAENPWTSWIRKSLVLSFYRAGFEDGVFIYDQDHSASVDLQEILDEMGCTTLSIEDLVSRGATDPLLLDSVYIVSELIGSGDTITDTVNSILNLGIGIKAIITLVDTRAIISDIEGIPVFATIHNKVDKFYPGSTEFNDISKTPKKKINTDTGKWIINETSPVFELIPCYTTEQDYWDWAGESGIPEYAHAIKRDTRGGEIHHPLYINPAKLMESRVRITFQSVLELLEQRNRRIDLIVYPRHEETSILLSNKDDLPGTQLYAYDDIIGTARINSLINRNSILVFDTGTVTGATLERIRNSLERAGAETVDYFVVLNRLSEEDLANRLLSTYDSTLITMYNLDIKAYNPGSMCPFCKMEEEYKKRMQKYIDVNAKLLAEENYEWYRESKYNGDIEHAKKSMRLLGILCRNNGNDIEDELNELVRLRDYEGIREFSRYACCLGAIERALADKISQSKAIETIALELLAEKYLIFAASKLITNFFEIDIEECLASIMPMVGADKRLAFCLLDGIRDTRQKSYYRIKSTIDAFTGDRSTIDDRSIFYSEDIEKLLEIPYPIRRKKDAWSSFYSDEGYAHQTPGKALSKLIFHSQEALNNSDPNFSEAYNYVYFTGLINETIQFGYNRIQEMIDAFYNAIPEDTMLTAAAGSIYYQVNEIINPASDRYYKNLLGELGTIGNRIEDDRSLDFNSLQSILNISNTLYSYVFQKEREGGVLASAMCKEYASVSSVLNIISNEYSFVKMKGSYRDLRKRAILPEEFLLRHFRELADNVEKDPVAAILEISVKTLAGYIQVVFEDNGEGASELEINKGGGLSALQEEQYNGFTALRDRTAKGLKWIIMLDAVDDQYGG